MQAEILNKKEVAEIVGYHPNYFNTWKDSERGARFRRVVVELEPNRYNRASVERYVRGANY